MIPITSLVTIESASAIGPIFGVNGTKLMLTPFSFPEGPVRLKKLVDALGSVPVSFITAVIFRLGSVRSIKAWHERQFVW